MGLLMVEVGDNWHARWSGEQIEVVHQFERDGETVRFSTASYTGDIGEVLVADVNDLGRRWIMPIAQLYRGYTRDMRRYIYSDIYRGWPEWEPER